MLRVWLLYGRIVVSICEILASLLLRRKMDRLSCLQSLPFCTAPHTLSSFLFCFQWVSILLPSLCSSMAWLVVAIANTIDSAVNVVRNRLATAVSPCFCCYYVFLVYAAKSIIIAVCLFFDDFRFPFVKFWKSGLKF